jgi:hypothetical protein
VNHRISRKQSSLPAAGLYPLIALLAACAMPARFTGMMPMSFEAARNHPYSVRVTVTGGQDTEAVGRPHIPNLAFTQALIQSIRESQIFSSVIEGESKEEEYLLRVTLFSIDKRAFGRTVKLEAGWTLERADTATIAWQEAILSEFTEANVQVATEGAARNNIAQGLAKIGKLHL